MGVAKKPARRPPPGMEPLPGTVSAPNVWAEPRSLFFFRTGRLAGPDGESICEILALAESGAVLRSAGPFGPSQACTLELNSAHRLKAIVDWVDETMLGLEFSDRLQVREILARREPRFPYRPPRLPVAGVLEIRLGSQRLKVRSHDISESGIKVELPEYCAGVDAEVSLAGLGTMGGRVQWWRDGRAGISFRQPIPSGAFTRWVTRRLESRTG